jgi:hypothetical protein
VSSFLKLATAALRTSHHRTTKKPQIHAVPVDSEEEDGRPPPKPRHVTSSHKLSPRLTRIFRQHRKKAVEDVEDQQLDEDISRLLDSQQTSAATNLSTSAALPPNDSIMDDSEDDEDEVNESLLVEY